MGLANAVDISAGPHRLAPEVDGGDGIGRRTAYPPARFNSLACPERANGARVNERAPQSLLGGVAVAIEHLVGQVANARHDVLAACGPTRTARIAGFERGAGGVSRHAVYRLRAPFRDGITLR